MNEFCNAEVIDFGVVAFGSDGAAIDGPRSQRTAPTMKSSTFCRSAVALGALALLAFAAKDAQAATAYYTTNNASLAPNVTGNAIIGFANASMTTAYSPTITMTGGKITSGTDVFNASNFTLNGGNIGGILTANNTSAVTVSGGTLGNDLQAFDSSKVTVSGGTLKGGLYVAGSTAKLTYKGGALTGNLYVLDGTLDIDGANLSATLLDSDAMTAIYTLSGTLNDGGSISGKTVNVSYTVPTAHLTFNGMPVVTTPPPPATPAPGSLLVLAGGFAGLGVRLARKRRK